MKPVYLYVICRADGPARSPCKVGITDNPASRLRSLKTASPYELVIFEMWDFPTREFALGAESMAHAALKRYRLSGEWFDVEPKEAVSILTVWFFWSAKAFADPDDEPLPMPDPGRGVGLVANGMADSRGRLL